MCRVTRRELLLGSAALFSLTKSDALEVLPKIRALTDKPIRFAFDTHHHGDHVYGNQIWVENGAVPVAHTGVVEEMKKYETGHYGHVHQHHV